MSRETTVPTRAGELPALLDVPRDASALVIFAHGSGSSRLSPRNQEVAGALNDAGFATLLFDLLTPSEHAVDGRTRELRFNIPLLADRVADAVDWAGVDERVFGLPVVLFGASTGAAAALVVAAERPGDVSAVVSRGGRPDLAGNALEMVRCPVCLIIGARDEAVVEMNREASERMNVEPIFHIVPRATHLFEEPGTLERVVELTAAFVREVVEGARTG